jgi:DNA-binding transcriptional LysR family regulator
MSELIIEKAADFVLFAKVVEAGGFTAASKIIQVPQASISRRIAELESALNVRLLERTTRKISVTNAGARIYEHAKTIIEALESAQAVAASLQLKPSGVIKLTAPVILGQYFLAKIIADFCHIYPEVSFQVELTGRRVDLIEEGYDLAVRVGNLNISSLVKIPLITAKQAYYASPDLAKRIIDFREFKKENWLALSTKNSLSKWKLLEENSSKLVASYEKKPLIESNDIEVLMSAAKNGLGIAILPEFAPDEDLVRVLPNYISENVDINALVVSRKSIVPAIRLFIDFMKVQLPEVLNSTIKQQNS